MERLIYLDGAGSSNESILQLSGWTPLRSILPCELENSCLYSTDNVADVYMSRAECIKQFFWHDFTSSAQIPNDDPAM